MRRAPLKLAELSAKRGNDVLFQLFDALPLLGRGLRARHVCGISDEKIVTEPHAQQRREHAKRAAPLVGDTNPVKVPIAVLAPQTCACAKGLVLRSDDPERVINEAGILVCKLMIARVPKMPPMRLRLPDRLSEQCASDQLAAKAALVGRPDVSVESVEHALERVKAFVLNE